MRRWLKQADIDDAVVDSQTSSEQSELAQLRRDKRRLEMEKEILRRAAAYFAGHGGRTLAARPTLRSVLAPGLVQPEQAHPGVDDAHDGEDCCHVPVRGQVWL